MDMAQSSGRPVDGFRNGGEGLCHVPFAGTACAYEILALAGRRSVKADEVHSRAGDWKPG